MNILDSSDSSQPCSWDKNVRPRPYFLYSNKKTWALCEASTSFKYPPLSLSLWEKLYKLLNYMLLCNSFRNQKVEIEHWVKNQYSLSFNAFNFRWCVESSRVPCCRDYGDICQRYFTLQHVTSYCLFCPISRWVFFLVLKIFLISNCEISAPVQCATSQAMVRRSHIFSDPKTGRGSLNLSVVCDDVPCGSLTII